MEKVKEYKSLVLFHIFVNFLIVIFITGSSYYHIPLNGFKDTLAYLIHLCLLQSTIAGIIYVISLQRRLFYVVFPLFYIIYGLIAYWKYTMDISVSSSLINVVLQTKAYVVKDLISFSFVGYVFLIVASLYGILKFYSKVEHKKGLPVLLPVSILLISVFFMIEKKDPILLNLDYHINYIIVF